MKKVFVSICLLLAAQFGFAQDPGDLNVAGTSFSQTVIAVNGLTTLQTTVVNVDFGGGHAIPVAPDPADRLYILVSVSGNYYKPTPLGPAAVSGAGAAYFTWTLEPDNETLRGTISTAIPVGAGGPIFVSIKGIQQSGGVALQTGVEIQDPGGLSDNNGGNNVGTALLTVTNPLAVSFTDIAAKKTGCEVKVTWANSLELNLDKYELEASKNGRDFIKVGETLPTNSRSYVNQFILDDQTAAATIYVRVKALDKDGKMNYSSTVSLNGLCTDNSWNITAYPVPVKKESFITLSAKSGVFNGKYALTIIDKAGKQINSTEAVISNSKTHKYVLDRTLAAGKYYLKVSNKDGSQRQTLAIEIL